LNLLPLIPSSHNLNTEAAATLVDGVQAMLRLYRDNRNRHEEIEARLEIYCDLGLISSRPSPRLFRAQDTVTQLNAARDRLKVCRW